MVCLDLEHLRVLSGMSERAAACLFSGKSSINHWYIPCDSEMDGKVKGYAARDERVLFRLSQYEGRLWLARRHS